MTDVVIVDAARTPVGKRNGALREVHPVKLGAHAVKAAMERAGITPDQVDHLIFGCVSQVAEQTFNIARNVVLASPLKSLQRALISSVAAASKPCIWRRQWSPAGRRKLWSLVVWKA